MEYQAGREFAWAVDSDDHLELARALFAGLSMSGEYLSGTDVDDRQKFLNEYGAVLCEQVEAQTYTIGEWIEYWETLGYPEASERSNNVLDVMRLAVLETLMSESFDVIYAVLFDTGWRPLDKNDPIEYKRPYLVTFSGGVVRIPMRREWSDGNCEITGTSVEERVPLTAALFNGLPEGVYYLWEDHRARAVLGLGF